MGNKGNPPVIVAIRAIVISMKGLDGCIFALLGDVPRSLHVDKQVMKGPNEFRVVEFKSFGRK